MVKVEDMTETESAGVDHRHVDSLAAFGARGGDPRTGAVETDHSQPVFGSFILFSELHDG